jgi:hypothetical protein
MQLFSRIEHGGGSHLPNLDRILAVPFPKDTEMMTQFPPAPQPLTATIADVLSNASNVRDMPDWWVNV